MLFIISGSDIFVDNWENALTKRSISQQKESTIKRCWQIVFEVLKSTFNIKGRYKRKYKTSMSDYSLLSDEEQEEDEIDFDWWTKFYASIEVLNLLFNIRCHFFLFKRIS